MKCPDCRTKMELTDWSPQPGIDPQMRQFRCPLCGETAYKVPKEAETLEEVKPQ